jgi:hypothetical protein
MGYSPCSSWELTGSRTGPYQKSILSFARYYYHEPLTNIHSWSKSIQVLTWNLGSEWSCLQYSWTLKNMQTFGVWKQRTTQLPIHTTDIFSQIYAIWTLAQYRAPVSEICCYWHASQVVLNIPHFYSSDPKITAHPKACNVQFCKV